MVCWGGNEIWPEKLGQFIGDIDKMLAGTYRSFCHLRVQLLTHSHCWEVELRLIGYLNRHVGLGIDAVVYVINGRLWSVRSSHVWREARVFIRHKSRRRSRLTVLSLFKMFVARTSPCRAASVGASVSLLTRRDSNCTVEVGGGDFW